MDETYSEVEEKTAWIPDIVGPIYKTENLPLREVLNAHRDDQCTRMMAAFVPDELIYEPDLSKKNFRKFNSVIALIDVTRLFGTYSKYTNANNGGSFALFKLLNRYMSIIIIEVYSSQGDVIKFSQDGLLVVWKVRRNEFVSRTVYNVILCGQRIQDSVMGLENDALVPKVDIVISTGEVTFSVIGNDIARHYVIGGVPIDELQCARRICLPGDLVLSASAWEYCAPSEYEYVIKDSSNVKIIKVLGPPAETVARHSSTVEDTQEERRASIVTEQLSRITTMSETSLHSAVESIFPGRVSVVDAYRRRLGTLLKTYLLKPVLSEIEIEEPLEYLTEVRKITAVSVNIVPIKSSIYELISLVDALFKIIVSVIEKYSGCIGIVNMYDRDILFTLMFGVKEYGGDADDEPNAENGLHSALRIMENTKHVAGVTSVSIGVSTGMAFCGVVGHVVRRQYMVFGTPVDKAISLMMISYGKISCDYEAFSDSSMDKHKFRSRGIKSLKRFGKCFAYEYIESLTKEESRSNLEYCYPILDRFQEIEYFKDIMDEIGVEGRSYSGMLIEGADRSGKSRLLDAFVTIVRNRQLQTIELVLHPSYTDKPYAVLYHVFLQLFNASDCTTIYDRERAISSSLCDTLNPEDFCYLNCIMRVEFPLSKSFCEETDWKRHTKTIEIFEQVLTKVCGRVCILLDNVQYMDVLSWQYFSIALSNINVVLVMTLQEPLSWDDLSQVEAAICQDKRLMTRTLTGLDAKYIAAFACQFLNVIAIPKSLNRVLRKRSKSTISWCEAFLISTIQVQALDFITISPLDVAKYDLVFPNSSMLVKIPAYLTPEDVAPPLHWSQMSSLNVCVPSDRPIGFIASNRDVTGLRIDIYNRMNSYEQDFIKCAAVIGRVFLRNTAEGVMVNSAPLYTRKAVAEMIKLRILQCALIQRKYFHSDDSVYYLFKKHKTFSNMHHLVICDCKSSRNLMEKSLPQYADCKVLEFTIDAYRKLLYDILPPHEKQDCHSKAVNFLERESRRCSTCGGGSFISLFETEETKNLSGFSIPMTSSSLHRKGSSWNRSDRFRMESRRSIFVAESSDAEKKRENYSIRKISVLPNHLDHEEEGNLTCITAQDSQIPIAFPRSVEPAINSDHGKNGYSLNDVRKYKRGHGSLSDDLWHSLLKEFSHINYRNCRCTEVVSFVFWNLFYHVQRSRDLDKLRHCMLEYTAGLIMTAQPLYATKFLTATIAKIETLKIKEHLLVDVPDSVADKGKTLILMGDAYVAIGNYSHANKFYTEAASLRTEPFQSYRAVCYRVIMDSLKRKFQGFPNYTLNKMIGEQAIQQLEIAVYLHRLATAFMLDNQAKIAKVTILDSLQIAFESAGGFVQKARIYLTALEIFRRFDSQEFVEPLEKLMAIIIDDNVHWKTADAIVVAVQVFESIYKSRILNGKLSEGIQIGIRICKICTAFHMTEMKLTLLPTLIEIMIWTKHLNEAVDLLQELYYMAKQDTDYSALTWYYALCLECILDTSMVLESYETCFRYYRSFFKSGDRSRSFILRDRQSIYRLTTCLAIYQLRMRVVASEMLMPNAEEFTEGITSENFSQIYNCIKALECYLLLLKRQINIKRSSDLYDRVQSVKMIMKTLQVVSDRAKFVIPFLHIMEAYMEILRGRKGSSHSYLNKVYKWASQQGNKFMLAWLEQNKRTWKDASYNNMAQYWAEHVSAGDTIRWQEINELGLSAWSTILFPLPIPDSSI